MFAHLVIMLKVPRLQRLLTRGKEMKRKILLSTHQRREPPLQCIFLFVCNSLLHLLSLIQAEIENFSSLLTIIFTNFFYAPSLLIIVFCFIGFQNQFLAEITWEKKRRNQGLKMFLVALFQLKKNLKSSKMLHGILYHTALINLQLYRGIC